MQNIPEQFKRLAESAELYDQSESIGQKFNLHIDQIGELDAEIRDILCGATDSRKFNQDLVERLEISPKQADEIVKEVNKTIFEAIRSNLQKSTTTQPQPNSLSPLERVGGFSVEKEPDETERKPVTPADRGSILNALENPPMNKAATIATPPDNLPTSDIGIANTAPGKVATKQKQEDSHIEPLVDYLLSNSVGQSTKTVSSTPKPPLKTAPIQPRPSGGIDPYREPIN